MISVKPETASTVTVKATESLSEKNYLLSINKTACNLLQRESGHLSTPLLLNQP